MHVSKRHLLCDSETGATGAWQGEVTTDTLATTSSLLQGPLSGTMEQHVQNRLAPYSSVIQFYCTVASGRRCKWRLLTGAFAASFCFGWLNRIHMQAGPHPVPTFIQMAMSEDHMLPDVQLCMHAEM